MEFFYVVKATQKSGKQDAVIWFTAKSEARAALTLDVELEEAGIETGRGKDYAKPIRTDFPVYNDLPEEGAVDYTWCERYELADDQRNWNIIPKAECALPAVPSCTDGTEEIETSSNAPELVTVATLPLRQRILAQFISDEYAYHIDAEQKKAIQQLEMDVDNSYVQNMLLAAENVEPFRKAAEIDISRLVTALKSVFPVEGKRTELSVVIQFFKTWFATEHIDRGLLVKEWVKGNRVSEINRTPSGANAGGGISSDRLTPINRLGLEYEIALGLLAREHEFDIYQIPLTIEFLANDLMNKMANKEFLATRELFVSMPGGLDYSRACNIATVKTTPENLWKDPVKHLEYLNRVMTETDHANPDELLVDIACGRSSSPMPMTLKPELLTDESIGKELATQRGEYVEGISDPTAQKWVHEDYNTASYEGGKTEAETTNDVQMETTQPEKVESTDPVQPGKGADAADTQAVTVATAVILAAAAPSLANQEQASVDHKTDSASQNSVPAHRNEPEPEQSEPELQQGEPAVEYPAYFEPGRYEGLPNDVYHAANGISSTQVKDARVSLMYYYARNVIKTIRRDGSDALTFGSLVHTIVLEPEKLHEEFAVFPGVPTEAFTNTDSLKAFIHEYNADKPKADQLKLTGKKEELQDAIRAVKPDAIFADEFEQQWRESVAGKTILSNEQLELATAIQQAIFSNSDANNLLCNPSRQSEVSYFGIDEETGLEIRVRPDIELRTGEDNICADLKTVSIGNVRQDRIKERLHREIIDRDYHLSAAMYCDVAGLDSFSWIFVNKEPGYHWVAVIQASETELELGRLEYRRVLRQINDAMENDVWPAPIIGTYTDELNDYDMRRLQALAEE